MNNILTTQSTIAGSLWPEQTANRWLRAVILAVLGTALLWLSAKVKVDIGPVPVTLQTLVILSLGAAYGWRLGAATLMLYLAEGAAGLPVFAGTPEKGIGLAYMAGPTGGYLLGFVLAAAVIGYFAERGFDRNPFKMFAAMLLATAVIYLPGLAWLATLIGGEKAIQFGLMPFIWADLIKAALAAAIFPAIWQLFKKS
ncbi:MAG: biotin transporter BioY [Hyphomicrobiales bacterium]|nr:biotin transporter BioY [Hyphomicrobiales bacterium]